MAAFFSRAARAIAAAFALESGTIGFLLIEFVANYIGFDRARQHGFEALPGSDTMPNLRSGDPTRRKTQENNLRPIGKVEVSPFLP